MTPPNALICCVVISATAAADKALRLVAVAADTTVVARAKPANVVVFIALICEAFKAPTCVAFKPLI